MKIERVVLIGGSGFVGLAIANAAGYRFGVSDQAFYLPSILRAADPTLFTRWALALIRVK